MASESAARRAAKKAGFRMVKGGRRHKDSPDNQGGFQLIDSRNIVVDGLRFDMTPDDVLAFVQRLKRQSAD